MRNHTSLTTDENPRCLCGALLDDADPVLCHKCRARSRWQRRHANPRRRANHTHGEDNR